MTGKPITNQGVNVTPVSWALVPPVLLRVMEYLYLELGRVRVNAALTYKGPRAELDLLSSTQQTEFLNTLKHQ